jgi:hypothetical protein
MDTLLTASTGRPIGNKVSKAVVLASIGKI